MGLRDDRTLAPGQFLLLYSEDVQSKYPPTRQP